MNRSFATAFGLLVLLHIYIGARLLGDLPIGATGRAFGIVLLIVSCATIPLSVTRASAASLQHRLSLVGLVMIGLFSSLFIFTLLRDLALLITTPVTPVERRAEVIELSAMAAAGAAVLASVLGFINARRRARIVRVEAPLTELPPALEGFTIAQISDIHVGPTIRRPYVEAIVDAVNALQPDVIAVTGDVVDGSVRELGPHVAPLGRLRARCGVYFVTGNHEYYSGEPAWSHEMARLGLRVLKNAHVVIEHQGAKLLLAGVTDFSAHHFIPSERSDPARALSGAPADVGIKILLAHQPRSAVAAEAAGFDLQLSGHTHGGQFWPWVYFVRLQQPITYGLHRLNRMLIYASRGSGYWGPPKRFGAPSEITLLRLVRAAPSVRRTIAWRGDRFEELRRVSWRSQPGG